MSTNICLLPMLNQLFLRVFSLTVILMSVSGKLQFKKDSYFHKFYNMDGDTVSGGSNISNKQGYYLEFINCGKWAKGNQDNIIAEWAPRLMSNAMIKIKTMDTVSSIINLSHYTSMRYYKDGSVVFGRNPNTYALRNNISGALSQLDALQKEKGGLSGINKVASLKINTTDMWNDVKNLLDFHVRIIQNWQEVEMTNSMLEKSFEKLFRYVGGVIYTRKYVRVKKFNSSLYNEMDWGRYQQQFEKDLQESWNRRKNQSSNGLDAAKSIVKKFVDMFGGYMEDVIRGVPTQYINAMPDSPISRAFDQNPGIKNYRGLVNEMKKLKGFEWETYRNMFNNHESIQFMMGILNKIFQKNSGEIINNLTVSSPFWTKNDRKNSKQSLLDYSCNEVQLTNNGFDIVFENTFGALLTEYIEGYLEVFESILEDAKLSFGNKSASGTDVNFMKMVAKLKVFGYVQIDPEADKAMIATDSFDIFEEARLLLV